MATPAPAPRADAATDLDAVQALAAAVADQVRDPELPMLTLAQLGVLRDVRLEPGEDDVPLVVVTITPTYTGCPATATMRADLTRRLREAGLPRVQVRLALDPPWSSDLIDEAGRAALRAAGISPPDPHRQPHRHPTIGPGDTAAPGRTSTDPVPLTLSTTPPPSPSCPRCGAPDAEPLSRFGPTPCTALYRCTACRAPFEHVKES